MFTAGVRGRTSTKRRGAGGAFVALAALAMGAAFAAPAQAAPKAYTFTKVADSAANGFNPQTLSVACPSINNGGDIAFKSERNTDAGVVDGIYRADAGGGITPIFEVPAGGGALLANGSPSMNDSGQVSFGAISSEGVRTIMRGDGINLTTIASTTTEFASFGDNTSINDLGEVAFDAVLDSGARGLFSGSDGVTTTTHYTDAVDATVDGSPARFSGIEDRPSINNSGEIAFLEEIQDTFDRQVYRGQEESFTTISAANPPRGLTSPLLNNSGTVAWQTSFSDEAGFFVDAIVTGDGDGADTTVVDSSGAFNLFDSYAINSTGTVAFSATLDDDELGIPSIYVGPNAKKNRVIGSGDKFDDGTVAGVRFCEEGLNDSGELAFVAEIEDRNGEVRAAVFRATLRR